MDLKELKSEKPTDESRQVDNIVILPEIKLKVGRLTIDFDRNYGCDKRTGWSIAWAGHYLVQLERHLFIAFFKAVRTI